MSYAADAHLSIKDALFGPDRSRSHEFERIVPCVVAAAFDRINRRGNSSYATYENATIKVEETYKELDKGDLDVDLAKKKFKLI